MMEMSSEVEKYIGHNQTVGQSPMTGTYVPLTSELSQQYFDSGSESTSPDFYVLF